MGMEEENESALGLNSKLLVNHLEMTEKGDDRVVDGFL